MTRKSREILSLLHQAAASAENSIDAVRRHLWEKNPENRPRQIVAYQGYADATTVHLHGRVLANRPGGGPLDRDGWAENLMNTYRRWESDEVAGAKVALNFRGETRTVVTDEEGYYGAAFPATAADEEDLRWLTATARVGEGEEEIEATHDILAPGRAGFGIISDMDDTVIHTGVTSFLLAAKLTFLGNSKTRKPLDGVAKLYDALQHGHVGKPVNPIFYISSSPWNLYDLLVDFLRLNEIPAGPLLLQDLGLDRTKFIKKKGHGHKQEKALRLLEAYPGLPFILIGDSGQEDPSIYAEVARQLPDRIKAIYIRDVDPGKDSELDAKVHRAIELAAAVSVPMILVRDSLMISQHASGIGLIPSSVIPEVVSDVQSDKLLPDTGKQAMEDAVDSVLPGKPGEE